MLGSIIGGIASIGASLLGKSATQKANEQNAALQKEFAQNSIQWKAEDARKAGIHPLYAMGAPTISASPSYVGDASLPSAMASVGQDIGRAVDATRTAPQKLSAVAATAQGLELERASLQNDLLRAQIGEIASRNVQAPPMASAVDPYRIPGQTQSGVRDVPLERIYNAHGLPYMEAGPVTDVGFTRTDGGGLAPVYSADAKTRLEDDWGGMLAWNLRNRVMPSLGFGHRLPPPPKGTAWSFNPITQEYRAVRLGSAF